jgi:hypothetical protein
MEKIIRCEKRVVEVDDVSFDCKIELTNDNRVKIFATIFINGKEFRSSINHPLHIYSNYNDGHSAILLETHILDVCQKALGLSKRVLAKKSEVEKVFNLFQDIDLK